MKKKIILLNILIIMVFILTGCWNARELNTLGIALVMGIDLENDKILLTAEVIEPVPAKMQSSMERGSAVRYVQGRGENIFEAFRDITLKFDRRIFIAHNKIIIFGEDFVNGRSVNDIDLLVRDHEQRESAYLLMAKGAKAYEVMGVDAGLEEIPGNYILELVENFKYNPKVMKTPLSDFLKYFYGTDRMPILGVIEKIEKNKINKSGKGTSDKEYELSVIGSAVFFKDNLVGYLGGNDTKGVNFINGKVDQGIVTFPTPQATSGEASKGSKVSAKRTNKNNISTMRIVKVKSKKDIEVRDGNIVLKVKIKLRGSVGEVAGDLDISTEEGMHRLEKACSQQIKKGVESAFLKVQKEYKSDVFGFGSVFHRKYPEEWERISEKWNKIFSEADIQVEVETKAIRTGLTNTPINIIKGK